MSKHQVSFGEALSGTPMRYLMRDGVRSAPMEGGSLDLGKNEDLSRATNHLFGSAYLPDPVTTVFMTGLLSQEDHRGKTARMFARDNSFGPYLIDMINGYRRLLTNGTVKSIFEFTVRRVDWQVVANKLKELS